MINVLILLFYLSLVISMYYNELMIKNFLLEKLVNRPSTYAKFSYGHRVYCDISNKLRKIISNQNNLDVINKNWNSCEAMAITRLYDDLLLVFERIVNEDDGTQASFNFYTNPYEITFNLSDFKNKKLDVNNLSEKFNTQFFQVVLSHELFHYTQTKEYGVGEMKKNDSQVTDFIDSPVELEAYVFMITEHAILNGERITTLTSLVNYLNDLQDRNLNTAKVAIQGNLLAVEDILNHNKDFLTESNSYIDKNHLLSFNENEPIINPKPIYERKYRCLGYPNHGIVRINQSIIND